MWFLWLLTFQSLFSRGSSLEAHKSKLFSYYKKLYMYLVFNDPVKEKHDLYWWEVVKVCVKIINVYAHTMFFFLLILIKTSATVAISYNFFF
jgi:hypothetical protein